MSMLEVTLDPATVVVAVDPGKVMNRICVPVTVRRCIARDKYPRQARLGSYH
jgi:hypothetical protein